MIFPVRSHLISRLKYLQRSLYILDLQTLFKLCVTRLYLYSSYTLFCLTLDVLVWFSLCSNLLILNFLTIFVVFVISVSKYAFVTCYLHISTVRLPSHHQPLFSSLHVVYWRFIVGFYLFALWLRGSLFLCKNLPVHPEFSA